MDIMEQPKPKNAQDTGTKQKGQDPSLRTDKEKNAAEEQKQRKTQDESVPNGKGPRSEGGPNEQGDR